uniref:Putative secreted protein n=1 Tax=Anopheles darlingi TaxID=43151 RepID=A0A2M4D4D4_ANODA
MGVYGLSMAWIPFHLQGRQLVFVLCCNSVSGFIQMSCPNVISTFNSKATSYSAMNWPLQMLYRAYMVSVLL